MMRSLACIVLLSCLGLLASAETHRFSTEAVRELHPVTEYTLHHEGHLKSMHAVEGVRLPYGDKIHVRFSGLGQNFDLPLTAMRKLFTPNSFTEVWAGDKLVEKIPNEMTSYWSEPSDLTQDWAVATLYVDGSMQGMVFQNGQLFHITQLRQHETQLSAESVSTLKQQGAKMVIYRDEDLILDDAQKHHCGVAQTAQDGKTVVGHTHAATTARRLLAVSRWTDCFPNGNTQTMGLTVGVAADVGFFKLFGTADATRKYLAATFAQINVVYFTQLNVFLQTGSFVIQSAAGGPGWNMDRVGGTCYTIESALDLFTNWRKTTYPNTMGLWHLFSDCYPPPGTVGLAWVGTLCGAQGTGVSTFSSTTWLTVAHEIGHNFGASHTFQLGQGTTGGIMDYGDGKLNGEFQFNTVYSKSEMCTEIATSMAAFYGKITGTCWAPFSAKCGNGVVEPGEQCDDTTTCCNQATCQFASASFTCTPASNECCDATCVNAPTTKTCGNGMGYCAAGACVDSVCNQYSDLSFCGINPQNSCKQMCKFASTGQCSTMSGYTAPNVNIADGTVCSLSPYSTCKTGSCVATTAPTSYFWVTGAWSTCSATCGSGTQSRTVTCQSSSGAVMSDSSCTATKPVTTQTCSAATTSCASYSFSYSAWSTCSATCGGGTQTRTATCINSATGGSVAQAYCGTPVTSQSCGTTACPPRFVTGAWSTCSEVCGTGAQTRSVTCMQFFNGADQLVADTVCTGTGLTKPATSQSCTNGACTTSSFWSTGAWSACSVTCGSGGVQTRSVACVDSTGAIQTDASCSTTAKPATSQTCSATACTTYSWNIGTWGTCSVSCGSGSQTRSVTCRDSTGVSAVEQYCSAVVKPATAQTCTRVACARYAFVTSAWSACSVTCGTGTSTRTFRCMDTSTNLQVANTFCTGLGLVTPTTSQSCSLAACSPSYYWSSGTWGTCSVTCGSGTQTRTATCRSSGSNLAVSSTFCTGQTRPATSQTCAMPTCPSTTTSTYFWGVSAWSNCTVACGSGTRTRRVACLFGTSASFSVVADTSCSATTKPASIETCNTTPCPYVWQALTPQLACSSCGIGTVSRPVLCSPANSTDVVSASEQQCNSAPKPSTDVPCSSEACPTVVPGPWSACDAKCGEGQRFRNLTCVSASGEQLPLEQCNIDAMDDDDLPDMAETCFADPCPVWFRNDWSPCSQVCGGGVQTRSLECRMPLAAPWYGKLADESLCPEMRPATIQSCNFFYCPRHYFKLGAWSDCSAPCGTTGVRTATTTCLSSVTGAPAPRSWCNAYYSSAVPVNVTVPCNTFSCPRYSWYSSEWGVCRGVCGSSLQTRNVTCVNLGGSRFLNIEPVDESFCAGQTKPEASRACAAAGSCGARGKCVNGACVCAMGYTGSACDIAPASGNVTIDQAGLFPNGLPLNEPVVVRWNTRGDVPFVSLLLLHPSFQVPRYVALKVRNNGRFVWTVSPGPLGLQDGNYTIRVWFSPAAFADSAPFKLAEPCAYVSCSGRGTCVNGKCQCLSGFSGPRCAARLCDLCRAQSSNCSDTDGVCQCLNGWTGPQCRTSPLCSTLSACANRGFRTEDRAVVTANSTMADAARLCGNCVCTGGWKGPLCDQCPRNCTNGGVPNQDCTACVCPAGFFGLRCRCKYLEVKAALRFSDRPAWVDDVAGLQQFSAALSLDVALALRVAEHTITVTVDPNSQDTSDPRRVIVVTRVHENCAEIAALAHKTIGMEREGVGAVALGNNWPYGKLAATLTADGSETLSDTATRLASMFADPASPLFNGVVSSNADTSYPASVTDPSNPSGGSPADSGASSSKGLSTAAIIAIAASVGGCVLIGAVVLGVFCYRKKRAASSSSGAGDVYSLPLGPVGK